MHTIRAIDPDAQPQATHAENEAELADYLVATPDFFVRHAQVLLNARVPDPNAGRAISLHQRQLDVLRERHSNLEHRLSELMSRAQVNETIATKLATWTRDLLLVREATQMPAMVVDGLHQIFEIPQVALRLWSLLPDCHQGSYADDVDVDIQRQTQALTQPYCGLTGDIAQAQWLDDEVGVARSVALLPLRSSDTHSAFGLIVFGSPDPDRFQAGMGTAFLDRIAQTASAALERMIAREHCTKKQ